MKKIDIGDVLIIGGIILIAIGVLCSILGVPYSLFKYGLFNMGISLKVYGIITGVCTLTGCTTAYIGTRIQK